MIISLWKSPSVSYSSKTIDVDLSQPDSYGNLTIVGKSLQQLPQFGVLECDESQATLNMRLRGYWIMGGKHYVYLQDALYLFSGGEFQHIAVPIGSLADVAMHEDSNGVKLLACGQNYFVAIDGTDFERVAKVFQGTASCQGRAFAFDGNKLYFSALDDPTDFSEEYGHGGSIVVSQSENIVKLVAIEKKLHIVLDHSIMVLDMDFDVTNWQLTTLLSTPYQLTANNVTCSGINLYACVEGKVLVLSGNVLKLVEQLHFGQVTCCAIANGNIYISADNHMIIYDLTRGTTGIVDVAVGFMSSTPNRLVFVESELNKTIYTDSQFDDVRHYDDRWWKKSVSFGGDTVRIDSVELLSSQTVTVILLSDSGDSATFALGGQGETEILLANVKGKVMNISLECQCENISIKQLKLHYSITKEG